MGNVVQCGINILKWDFDECFGDSNNKLFCQILGAVNNFEEVQSLTNSFDNLLETAF